MRKDLINVRNFGLMYVAFALAYKVGLGFITDIQAASSVINIISFVIMIPWFLFVRSMARFCEDKKLEKLNNILSVLFAILFVFINFIFTKQFMTNLASYENKLTLFLLAIVLIVFSISSLILFFVVYYKMSKTSKSKIFLLLFYFTIALIVSIVIAAFFFSSHIQTITTFASMGGYIYVGLLFYGVVKFYKEHSQTS